MTDPALVVIPSVPGQLAEDGHWFPPVTAFHLSNVQLDVNSGLVFSRDWVVNGSGTGQRWAMDSAFITGATVRVRESAIRPEARTVTPLANVIEHYHFIMETLPQVLRIQQVAPDAIHVTADRPPELVAGILNDLGVRWEVLDRDEVLTCSSVWMCPGHPRERTHPADMQLLLDTFAPSRDRTTAGHGDRVYISRARSGRSLSGERNLEEWLVSRGFAILYLEDLAFTEQVSRLNHASLVVAPHGGGLANTVFMPPGGTVIEIATGEWWSNAFRRIAHIRGHTYHLLMIESTPGAPWGSATETIARLGPILDALDSTPDMGLTE